MSTNAIIADLEDRSSTDRQHLICQGLSDCLHALMDDVFKAMQLLGTSPGKPQGNAMIAMNLAKKHVGEVLSKVNNFFETDWKKYQDKVESVKYSLFKKYEPIKND